MKLITKAGLGLLGGLAAIGAVFGDPAPPPSATPAATVAAGPSPALLAARRDACAPFGNVAAAAWELAQRGIREDVAVRTATSQVTATALLPLVRDAVHAGYATRTQEGARHRATSFCESGTLGR